MAFLGNRYIKILIAFVLVLFFIFVSPNDSNADTIVANNRMTTDVNLALKNEMNSRMQFIYSIFFAKWDTMTQQQKNATRGIAQNMLYYNYYIDTVYTQYSGNTYAQYVIYFYKSKNISALSVGTNQLLIYYKDTDMDVDRFDIGTYIVTIESMYVVRDLAIINEYPSYNIVADVSNIGINGKKAGDSIDIWQPLFQYKGDFEIYRSIINGINNDFKSFGGANDRLLEDIYNSTDTMSDKVSELTDFVKDDNVDSSSSDFPMHSGVDSSNINGAIGLGLTSIYNKWTSGDSPDIVFPIPHTSNNITLKGNYVSNSLYQNNGAWIVGFVQIVWSFVIYGWVIKDIYHYFDQMKNGDIVNNKDSNIQTTML